jgi:uncharacterized OsmC-like protein
MDEVHDERGGVRLTREEAFRFRIRFGAEAFPTILTDEPPPVGTGAGPNPSALLAAAIGNCLAASLLFCMEKARLEARAFEAEVHVTQVRNPAGRLRIGEVRVCLAPTVTSEVQAAMGRCLALFESFCVVTESVRHGIPISVSVEPRLAEGVEVPAGVVEHAPCSLTGEG